MCLFWQIALLLESKCAQTYLKKINWNLDRQHFGFDPMKKQELLLLLLWTPMPPQLSLFIYF